jgi:glycosyltransferase involved in cell wall biosynthesis
VAIGGSPMKPFVSVVIPCRDEAAFLEGCLRSVLASDYPPERMEVLVAEGMSTDDTPSVIERVALSDRRVRRIENSARTTPAGLNLAIAASIGEIIVRVDSHASISREYISRGVEHLLNGAADNVGGPMRTVARDHGLFARAVQTVLSHPFGVGNSHFRTGGALTEPLDVDTVFGGCWKKEVFARVGVFNEKLTRGQDMEFNLRLKRAGGKILLTPDMRSEYYARATLGSFCRHNWTNGVWAILPFAYSREMPVQWRHLTPMIFAMTLLVVGAVALVWPNVRWAPLIPASVYLMAVVIATTHAGLRDGDWRPVPLLLLAFACLHLPYGAGSIWGLVKTVREVAARRFQ